MINDGIHLIVYGGKNGILIYHEISKFKLPEGCINDCSQNGVCLNNSCICKDMYQGIFIYFFKF